MIWPSTPAAATLSPEASNATLVSDLPASRISGAAPLPGRHSATVPSVAAEAITSSDGPNATLATTPARGGALATWTPVSAFHTRTIPSAPDAATSRPLGLIATSVTGPV